MTDFFSMGGYAIYVWSAYGITMLTLILVFVWPLWRKKTVFKALHNIKARQQQLKQRQHET